MKKAIERINTIMLIIVSLFFLSCTSPEQDNNTEPVSEETNEPPSIEIGVKISGFRANDDKGNVWKLEDNLGSSYLVVYFYPAAMTSGCTLQACSYRDNSAELEKLGVKVIGISGDSVSNLKIFREAHNLNFTLLSDVDGAIAGLFGVPLREGGEITRNIGGIDVSMIRSYTSSRWTFILDSEGTVIYKDTEVNAENDSNDVIEFLQTL